MNRILELIPQDPLDFPDSLVIQILGSFEYGASSSSVIATELYNNSSDVQKRMFKVFLFYWLNDNTQIVIPNKYKMNVGEGIWPPKFPSSLKAILSNVNLYQLLDIDIDQYEFEIWSFMQKFRNKIPFINSFGEPPTKDRKAPRIDLEIEVCILLSSKLRIAYSLSADGTCLISNVDESHNINSERYLQFISGEWIPEVLKTSIRQEIKSKQEYKIAAAYKRQSVTLDHQGLCRLLREVIFNAFPDFILLES